MSTDDERPAPEAVPEPAPAPANPFVPRYREPWLNPAKRTAALLIGAGAAVVLLVLGMLIGLGLGGGGHRHGFQSYEFHGSQRFDGPFPHHFRYGPGPMPGRGHGYGRVYGPGRPVPSSIPATPVPSSSHR